MTIKTIALLGGASLAALASAGCTPVDHGYGETMAYIKAAQTVDPDPVYTEDDAKPGDNGEIAAAAAERYREGNVTQVEAESATAGAGGG